eukprot:CAMPEP_0174234950 /NCGR_PEP_ID=MMETSP0417-20130205/4555_1 /TAXON_ID=242541 /ORGANISM="Mayorella sp, Strain BSH-02190019" /LENGTH=274 /DNA_ID=CAMNT_0015313381 /DNA_START=105 /DNA_END=929 /DNA_ORIENTATION=+
MNRSVTVLCVCVLLLACLWRAGILRGEFSYSAEVSWPERHSPSPSPPQPPLVVALIGNMASGKTTVGTLLEQRLGIQKARYVREPFAENPFLADYLRDHRRWGFTSGVRYFLDYAKVFAEEREHGSPILIVDAGTWTNLMLYAEFMLGEEILTEAEFSFYKELSDLIQDTYRIPALPDAFVYLHTPPAQCMDRLHRRGQLFQTSTVQLDYLELLHHYLDRMVSTAAQLAVPVLRLDTEQFDTDTLAGREYVFSSCAEFLLSCERRVEEQREIQK